MSVVPQALAQEFEIAEDHREQVVEVVRDTAGELADGLDLLRLAERRLGAPARGHVQKAADNPDELARSGPVRPAGDSASSTSPRFRNEPVFRVPQLAKRKQLRPIDLRALPADASVMNRSGAGPIDLLAAIAEQIEPSVADMLDAPIAIERMQGSGVRR